MKNIIDEKPVTELTGRLLATAQFVKDEDLTGKDVLDVGCGYGTFVLNFASRGARNVSGIEITEEDISTAKKYIHQSNVDLFLGSAIGIPFPDDSFDSVTSWEVIEHIPKNTESKMFFEIARVLRRGGSFYLSTPHRSFLSCVADPAWWLIGHRHYSKIFLISLAEHHGFAVETFEVRGKGFVLLNALNMYFSKWILRRGRLFASYFDKRDTAEYHLAGYVTIFMKMRKK